MKLSEKALKANNNLETRRQLMDALANNLVLAKKLSNENKLSEQVKQHIAKAKASGNKDQKATLLSGNNTSLSKVIKTKEQADLFMKILRSL